MPPVPYFDRDGLTFYQGDCRQVLAQLPEASVQACVTSPPYWGLRDYGVPGQLGQEPSPAAYAAALVETFRAVRRVLRKDGVLWLNLGDTYAGYHGNKKCGPGLPPSSTNGWTQGYNENRRGDRRPRDIGLKPKDLVGIPWRVAFALQADGWYLRADVIWHKPNPTPEAVVNRPTRAHEYLFLLTRSDRYFYDADAIREPHESAYSRDVLRKGKAGGPRPPGNNFSKQARHEGGEKTPRTRAERAALLNPKGRNKRSVWTVPLRPFRGAHFATFPPALVEPCVLAGSRPGDVVLDPFAGAGTTALVARQLGRRCVGVELNAEYLELARRRLWPDADTAAA